MYDSAALNAKKRIQSGTKYQIQTGGSAIKDGIKTTHHRKQAQSLKRKPEWLKIKIVSSPKLNKLRKIVRQHQLATVCEESHCPNLSECWSHGTATIMLMGAVCTRACRFCAVDTGNPNGWLDHDEPAKVAASIALMDLRYIVLTSVDRDDLSDSGAHHFAATIKAIKQQCPDVAVEALTPDFSGDLDAIRTVVCSGLEVFAQNIETVRRLTHWVRDPRAGYERTLEVLRVAKTMAPVLTKTSLMLGLGETDSEIAATMRDLRAVGCDILTLGQYLRPTTNHLPLERWVKPGEFEAYRELGLNLGFLEVAAGPLVRSSYRADRILEGNNLGLKRHESIPVRQL